MIKERLSYSLISKLLTQSIPKVVHGIQNKPKATAPMSRGLRFEQVLMDGNIEGLRIWTDTKTKGVKFHAWAEEQDVEPYMLVTPEEADETASFLGAMQTQGIVDLINGMTYQEHFELPDVHAYFDFSNDTDIYELKVTSKSNQWGKEVVNSNYDVQLYIATLSGKNFHWIVVEDTAPYFAFIGEPHCDLIQSGREKYMKAKELFRNLNSYEGLSIAQVKTVEPPTWLKLSHEVTL